MDTEAWKKYARKALQFRLREKEREKYAFSIFHFGSQPPGRPTVVGETAVKAGAQGHRKAKGGAPSPPAAGAAPGEGVQASTERPLPVFLQLFSQS